jgi:MOSC domain-containing protein YiiM
MHVEHIFIGRSSGATQTECEQVSLVAGSGIVGDRYYGRHDEPGQNVTLIEAEVVEAFIREQGLAYDLSITHRNIVTRAIRLNELVGREFIVGNARLRGVELCEPCLGLGTALASATISPAGVVKRLVHQGGLRADVVSSGVIARGAEIRIDV